MLVLVNYLLICLLQSLLLELYCYIVIRIYVCVCMMYVCLHIYTLLEIVKKSSCVRKGILLVPNEYSNTSIPLMAELDGRTHGLGRVWIRCPDGIGRMWIWFLTESNGRAYGQSVLKWSHNGITRTPTKY